MKLKLKSLINSILKCKNKKRVKKIERPTGTPTILSLGDKGDIEIIKSLEQNCTYLKVKVRHNKGTRYDCYIAEYLEETLLDILYQLFTGILNNTDWGYTLNKEVGKVLLPNIIEELSIYGNTRSSRVYFANPGKTSYDIHYSMVVTKTPLVELGAMNVFSEGGEYHLGHCYDKEAIKSNHIHGFDRLYEGYIKDELGYIARHRRDTEKTISTSCYFEIVSEPKPLTNHILLNATVPTNPTAKKMWDRFGNFFNPYQASINQLTNSPTAYSIVTGSDLDDLFVRYNVNVRVILSGVGFNWQWRNY